MKYSSIPTAQMVVQHCKAKGIKDIVISPGSRNAPLTISFTEDPFFNCYSIVDERCASFFALGRAQQTQHPVMVLCTSGSALLNYYPAVAEAFYSRIPLVVLSADRPFYKIDVGDGQTIRQDHVFDRHIGFSANLKQDATHATSIIEKYAPGYIQEKALDAQSEIEKYNNLTLNKALNLVLDQKLPVHINVPFEEPLYSTVSSIDVEVEVNEWSKSNEDLILGDKEAAVWNSSQKKMILVGVNHPNSVDEKILDQLANDPSVVVLTETTSNLHHKHFFPSIDSILAPIEKSGKREELYANLKPDLLLTFGGLIVSKKVKAFLRDFSPEHHWHIDPIRANDTFFVLTEHFKCEVNEFLEPLLSKGETIKSTYKADWLRFKNVYESVRNDYLQKIPFTDFSAFHQLIKSLPNHIQLQLANSSTIRYAQLFSIDSSIQVFCNRGTSGIEGSMSTAIGAASAIKKPTVFVTGDLSFFYDSNALWNNYLPIDFRIVVVNNDGGGIFRILPGQEESSNFETYFETKHQLDASHFCTMYGVEYIVAENADELQEKLTGFFQPSTSPKLMEIKTPRLLNNKILIEYFDFISSGIINQLL